MSTHTDGGHVITLYEDPRAMEAVRLYTDPLLPTFGNKRASATQAGVSRSVFMRVAVQEEIDRIVVQRMENSENTVAFLGTYAMDAAKELISQLSAGRDLCFISQEEIELASQSHMDGKLLASMVRHNKMVLDAFEQRRKAAVEIIRQQIGTPEQRIKVDHGDTEELPQLTDLPDDQLEELGSFISEALASRKLEEEEVEEADFEVVTPTEGETQEES